MSRLRETLHVGPAKAGTQVLGVEPHATPVVPDPSSIFPVKAGTTVWYVAEIPDRSRG